MRAPSVLSTVVTAIAVTAIWVVGLIAHQYIGPTVNPSDGAGLWGEGFLHGLFVGPNWFVSIWNSNATVFQAGTSPWYGLFFIAGTTPLPVIAGAGLVRLRKSKG